jgi:hypothetical protein
MYLFVVSHGTCSYRQWNPFYFIVGRPETKNLHFKGKQTDKYKIRYGDIRAYMFDKKTHKIVKTKAWDVLDYDYLLSQM